SVFEPPMMQFSWVVPPLLSEMLFLVESPRTSVFEVFTLKLPVPVRMLVSVIELQPAGFRSSGPIARDELLMYVAGTVLLAVKALVTRKPTPEAMTIRIASPRRADLRRRWCLRRVRITDSPPPSTYSPSTHSPAARAWRRS